MARAPYSSHTHPLFIKGNYYNDSILAKYFEFRQGRGEESLLNANDLVSDAG
ncbi:hypothetical protein Epro_0712 [Endomicrobium proavitum]|uniref:Uncharacterized protein n=1 Tax=Endomicrobium proavitum TaxID=1408281 RepID=A0A0G3WHI6_9BACT|nr:hypothetical protein Epro_0712 [Endomicrobium proavitum]